MEWVGGEESWRWNGPAGSRNDKKVLQREEKLKRKGVKVDLDWGQVDTLQVTELGEYGKCSGRLGQQNVTSKKVEEIKMNECVYICILCFGLFSSCF